MCAREHHSFCGADRPTASLSLSNRTQCLERKGERRRIGKILNTQVFMREEQRDLGCRHFPPPLWIPLAVWRRQWRRVSGLLRKREALPSLEENIRKFPNQNNRKTARERERIFVQIRKRRGRWNGRGERESEKEKVREREPRARVCLILWVRFLRLYATMDDRNPPNDSAECL